MIPIVPMRPLPTTLLLTILLLTACRPSPPSDSPASGAQASAEVSRPELLPLGRQIMSETFALLSSNLTNAIAQGGPTNALHFCSAQALSLTDSIAQRHQADIRRVSHRARNPGNRPSDAEFRLLREYQGGLSRGVTNPPVLHQHASGEVTFYAPILISQSTCLVCHGQPGTDIAPTTLATLDQLYPEDEARGFRLGDLRGLWAIRFPASPKPTPQ
jgi:hypothetical protein